MVELQPYCVSKQKQICDQDIMYNYAINYLLVSFIKKESVYLLFEYLL